MDLCLFLQGDFASNLRDLNSHQGWLQGYGLTSPKRSPTNTYRRLSRKADLDCRYAKSKTKMTSFHQHTLVIRI